MKATLKNVVFCMLAVHAHSSMAEDYGWLNKLTNNSGYFVRITTYDTGHNPRITVAQSKDMNTCPEGARDLQIGCKPFIVKQKQTISLSGFVIPFESKGGYIAIEVLNGSGTVRNKLFLQDVRGGIYSDSDKVPARVRRWQKDGDVNTEIIIETDGRINFKKQ